MNRTSSGSTLHLAVIGVLLLGILAGAFFLLRSGPEARSLPEAIDGAVLSGSSQAAGTAELAEPTESGQVAALPKKPLARVALDKEVEPAKAAKVKKSGPYLTGRAVDPYGNAVEGAWITVSPWSQMAQTLAMEQIGMTSSGGEAPKNSVVTDAEGRFKIHRRKKLGAEIALSGRGLGFLVTRDRRVLSSGDNEDQELEDLVLDPGIVIRGTVVNHEGEPVAGASVKRGKGAEGPLAVAAGFMEEFGMGGGGGVETDEYGSFELPYEEAGSYTLTAMHESYPDATIEGETPTHGALEGVVLHFAAPAKITGKLVAMPEAVSARLQAAANAGNDENSNGERIYVAAKLIEEGGAPTPDGGQAAILGMFGGMGGEQHEVNADGTFEIPGLRPGARYELAAFRKGGFMQKENCTEMVTIEAPSQVAELPYDKGAVLKFRVVDGRNSNPIEDLKIEHAWDGGENFMAEIMSSMGGAAETERYPGGRVELEELRPPSKDCLSTLTIHAPGFSALTKADILVPEDGELELGILRLQPAPVLRVQVLEAGTGKPISRVRVSFAEETTASSFASAPAATTGVRVQIGVGEGSELENMDLSEVFGDSVRGKTDKDGMVELTVFPTSRGVLRLKSTRYAAKKIENIVIAKNSGITTRTETISRGAEVVVLVLDEKGNPAPGIAVQHKGPEGLGVTDMAAKKTSKKGKVKYLRLSPGEHSFRVVEHAIEMGQGAISIDEFSGTDSADDDAWKVIQLADGAEVELRLDPPLRGLLEGTIRTSAGPLVGATVSLQIGSDENSEIAEMGGAWGEMLSTGGLKGRTNGDGHYKIDRIPVGDYVMIVRHPSRAVASRFEITTTQGTNNFNARLPGGAITGRVTDDAGQALSGAKVTVRRVGSGFDWAEIDDMSEAFGGMFGGRDGANTTTSGADGSYRFDGLPADTALRVSVRAEGHVPGRSNEVELDLDEIEHDVDVEVARGGSIRIRVTGQEAPFMRATARYEGEEEGIDRNRSAFVSGGTAVIDGLHPGTWTVDVDAPMSDEESESQTVTVTPGAESEVTIER